mmetsp:Transcript_19937/g.43500  ORF Transcript_19937/g.43500 Transcript_19937/m.43500 type:complete len:990 (-) Transcript_19937:3-2972(-)
MNANPALLSSPHSDVLSPAALTASSSSPEEATRRLLDEIKRRAKACVMTKDWYWADKLYARGIELLEGLDDDDGGGSGDDSNKKEELAILHSNRSLTLFHLTQLSQSQIEAQTAIDLNPDYVKAYWRLGQCSAALGDWDGALGAYEKAVEIDSRDDGEGGGKMVKALQKEVEKCKVKVEQERLLIMEGKFDDEAAAIGSASDGAGGGTNNRKKSATTTTAAAATATATATGPFEFDIDHTVSTSPICSGSIIPRCLLGEEHLDSGVHQAYTLTFVQKNAINADANPFIIPSTGMALLQDLSSLLQVSRRNVRQHAADSNSSSLEMPAPPTQNVRQHKSLLNLLPDNAIYLKETVDKAFGAIRQMFWPLYSPMKADLTMRTAYLLAGEAGGGRTHFALLIAALARVHFGVASTYLDCSKLQSSPDLRMGHILDELSEAFEEAAAKGPPSFLILDDLDSLVPNIDASNDDENDAMHHQQTNPALSAQVKLISDHLRHLIDRNVDICVLATCNTATSVAPSLRSLRGFSSVLSVPSLDSSQRVALFDATTKQLLSEDYKSTDVSVSDLVPSFGKQTEGYTPADLLSLAGRVAHAVHVRKLGRCSSFAANPNGIASRSSLLQEALDGYASISQKSLHVVKQGVAVEWSHIGGLFRAKATLTDVILRPVRYGAIYRNSPISLPRGILLYGPSGCGKTLIVPALAKECNFNVVKCNGPELLDKYIGASEAKVRQLFARAYAAAPCILFLDDFDALAPRRGSDHTGVTDRVVNQLLTFLDGVEGADNKNKGMVYIIGASSRPDKIDPALLRPGRLEKHVYVGYANSDEEWSDLFSGIALSRELDTSVYSLISSGEVLRQYGSKMNHLRSLSAADLKAVMDTAHLAAVHDYLDRKVDALVAFDDGADGGRRANQVTIQLNHLVEALRSARPSLSDDDKRMLTSIYAPFYSNGDGDSATASSMPPRGGFGLNATDGDSTDVSGVEYRSKDPELKTTLR